VLEFDQSTVFEGRTMSALPTGQAITRQDARAYQERWRLVHEAEVAELRQLSPDDKMRQLAALMALGRALGWLEVLESEPARRSENWLRLQRTGHG
jgi:hypothetical protein